MFIVLSFQISFAQAKSSKYAMCDELVFKEGEKLTYTIYYQCLGIKADVGKAVVVLNQSKDKSGRVFMYSRVVGSTTNFWDSFFKVRDLYECKFYPKDLRPFYFHRDIFEGNYKIKNYYKWNNNFDINARVERENVAPLDTVLKGTSDTYDILSLFYFARNIDFESILKGVNNPILFAIDDEIFSVYFRYIGKEEKKIYKLGVFKTMKFATKVIAGEVFTGEKEMIVWISDDGNRVPLMFESPIIVGRVGGRLTNFESLKYPLQCIK